MPELPEVETVRRGLEPYLSGARLSDTRLNRANLRYPFPDHFADRLNGATVMRLERRAKYLLAYMDTQEVWVTHLGMTGRFQIDDSDEGLGAYYHQVAPAEKHLHFQTVATQADGSKARIDFYDPRRFGFMLLMSPAELYESKWYAGLGVEPLSDDLNGDYLLSKAQGRALNLKALLMAQAGIVGLGNIYVCEALWRARLSPDRKAADLKPKEAEALTDAIKTVLSDAIASGGSSISDFAAASGELGYFQHRFCVYDRKGKPCPRDDGGTITRKVHQGRSTFYCPTCQI
ncbi:MULTISPECIES: bifunctional DNA-formamidopyrimidine glycosylase/DNA-(apurinic or apyrimidinic site) lyase [Asticcacaulis]|uniref:bifunctional DNA-formamidopyrimidine glycosylase/DNA-(apurinic or apyrimidinic site) lyase n=1 Tax=Asticcacaulis TaxID=76890 RepID=UPI001AE6482F|nr:MULTISPECIES: bifunctional DNA-formamidopyrimidine glycosylase/DNA-(apurinic or apyrimidinic site) lyase [Asticcacaulis]MBP2160068.1 formamidopyrimidine-DNA glycosylase [Asticcacaulis solisilvae]MDR6801113.1 formamidopyrimidine-DNA glycosylase [Asticcacaulis sp. BE141]